MNSTISNAQQIAANAVDQVKAGADTTRSSLVDLGVQALKLFNHVRAQESRYVDSALDHIGLQRRESALRPVLYFAAGALVAGGAALVLAPTSGDMLRKRLIELLSKAGDNVKSVAGSVTDTVAHSAFSKEGARELNHAKDTLRDAKDTAKEKINNPS
ncbi:MAG: hypothetical protein ABIP39_09030 [Polyangiaceae bacterium]